jgi:hypothetical protein
LDTQHLIAELDAERSRSQRLELQIGELLGQVAALTQKVTELTERLGQNSRNSHRPPSSDPPGTTGNSGSGQRLKSKRPRGGQRGHRGSRLAARGSSSSPQTRSTMSSISIRPSAKTAGPRSPSRVDGGNGVQDRR